MTMGDGVGWTSFHAITTEDASTVVDVIDGGVALATADPLPVRVLRGFDVDALRRAGGGTEEAGDALFETLLIALQDVHAPVPLLKDWRSIGIVLRQRRLQHLFEGDAHALRDRGSRLKDVGKFRHPNLLDYQVPHGEVSFSSFSRV